VGEIIVPRYLCSLPNNKSDERIPELISDDPVAIDAFVRKWDVPGRGVYECVSTLKPGATRRALETVDELYQIHVDIDLRALATPSEEVLSKLQALPLPLELRDSGGGYHVIAPLKESAHAGTPEFEHANQLRKSLTRLLCGDPMPDHAAALLRVVGSHNSKYGELRLCRIIRPGKSVDVTEVEELIGLLGDRSVFEPRPKTNRCGQDEDRAQFGESDGPVDINARLATMQFEGPGDSAIHITQLQCSAAMLRAGVPAEDVITQVLEATHHAVAGDKRAADWDWTEERFAIERMTYSQINKNPELAPLLPDVLFEQWQAQIDGNPQIIRDGAGWHVRATAQPDRDCDARTGRAHAEDANAGKQSAGKPDSRWPTPYSGRPATQIPQRKLILGNHYIAGASTVTASAGGIGKSTLSLLDAVSFRVGRNLLTGEALDRARRVWVWNAEDDIDEMERRVAGICAHYGIALTEAMDGLFLDSGYDLPLDLAYGNGKSAYVNDSLINRISARVKELGIEVVMLDPLVALHSMSEGDNPGHARLIRTLSTNLAKPCACAVDINAHTRKSGVGQETMTADDIRGPGAIVYSARSGRILNPMSLGEAEKYGIEAEDRFSYYRLERAKANMAKRGTVCWVRMIEVPIANRPDGSYGDVVAVPTLWVPPDAMSGITDTVANAIAGEIAKGDYKRDARAGAAWAGRLVGLRCGIDIGTKSGKDRAKAILETLIKRGVLAVEIRVDKNRNAREYVTPGVLHG
jgi:AAA domain